MHQGWEEPSIPFPAQGCPSLSYCKEPCSQHSPTSQLSKGPLIKVCCRGKWGTVKAPSLLLPAVRQGAGCGSGDGLVPPRASLLFVLSLGVQQC